MNRKLLTVSLVSCLALSFALSLAFWLIFDVFVLSGFVIWSLASGIVGALAGTFLVRSLAGGLAITAVVRIAVFVILSGLFF